MDNIIGRDGVNEFQTYATFELDWDGQALIEYQDEMIEKDESIQKIRLDKPAVRVES